VGKYVEEIRKVRWTTGKWCKGNVFVSVWFIQPE